MDKTKKKTWLEEIRNTFVTGLLLLIPLYITIWIVSVVFNIFDNAVPIIGRRFEGLGFLVTIIFILLLGASARNIFAKRLLKYFEDLLGKVPFVKNIYLSTKQVINAITNTSRSATFSKVVIIEYPRKDMYSIGFLTKEDNSSLEANGQPVASGMVSVFVPTVPNPTTGFFVILPRSEVKVLDMSVEQGFKMVISAGIITPDIMQISKN
ncbi:membrane protein containing DUF502 [sediment metagenome]|uniref:Membrane protein containing DUF502 n=1 Tax=sediment metagenome TaxID=749907 RepID=D9PMB8_9ZZZZ